MFALERVLSPYDDSFRGGRPILLVDLFDFVLLILLLVLLRVLLLPRTPRDKFLLPLILRFILPGKFIFDQRGLLLFVAPMLNNFSRSRARRFRSVFEPRRRRRRVRRREIRSIVLRLVYQNLWIIQLGTFPSI